VVKAISQAEMRAQVFRTLLPGGLRAIHWLDEWPIDTPRGRHGVVRFRAVFNGPAPHISTAGLWDFATPAEPEQVDENVLEFHLIYDRH
jgi:hypothetical protein